MKRTEIRVGEAYACYSATADRQYPYVRCVVVMDPAPWVDNWSGHVWDRPAGPRLQPVAALSVHSQRVASKSGVAVLQCTNPDLNKSMAQWTYGWDPAVVNLSMLRTTWREYVTTEAANRMAKEMATETLDRRISDLTASAVMLLGHAVKIERSWHAYGYKPGGYYSTSHVEVKIEDLEKIMDAATKDLWGG